jgi:glycosyltransferase involved in cell wall biosynthesis
VEIAERLKKVLYISYDGMTDPLGQSQVIPYLKRLSEHGYHFTVLSFEKKMRLQKEGDLVAKLIKEAGIEWVSLLFTSKPPIASKIYDRYKMWQKVLQLHKTEKFDLVHCRSYVAAEMGLRLKRKYGVKMLFDMRGFWADEKVDNGQWDMQKPFYRQLYNHYKQKEKQFLLQADGIVSLTEKAKSYLQEQPEYKHLSIEVIPCCADLDHFDYHKIREEQIPDVRSSLGIPNSAKVLVYLGSVGGWYMTKEMFRFFRKLSENHPEYVMLILTKDKPEEVKQEAAAEGIRADKVFVTYSGRKQLPAFVALSSFSIFFIRNTFSKQASSPTKHAELMGMGMPVVCNDIGDTGHIVSTTNTGLVINEFDDLSMNNAIEKVASLERMDKEYIRQCALQYFDLEQGVRKYLQLYNSILNVHAAYSLPAYH